MKKPLWTPTQERVEQTNLTRFMGFLKERVGRDFGDYDALYDWSVQEREAFWASIWDFCGVQASVPYEHVLTHGDELMNSRWFEGARLNFAQNLLRHRGDQVALHFCNEGGMERALTYDDLHRQVARLAASLREMGVQEGDRVVGFMPNLPETVVAMLAASSLGAIWSSTSPDFGLRGVLDRFGQIEPKVLFSADGYFYKGKANDSLARVAELCQEISSIEQVVVVPYVNDKPSLDGLPGAALWDDFLAGGEPPLEFAQLPFSHPLYIMYSSGTTGVPKCIVHGAGGTLLQHLKEHCLHVDVKPGDRLFYFTTCGWMMWNWLVSGLASKATVMLFDGSPFYPDPGVLWRLAEKHKWSFFGTSAKYLAALENAGYKPKEEVDLSALKGVLSTGSPLSAASFAYVYREIKEDLHLASISGGTDLISCFMLGSPIDPVYSEEIQRRGLGMKVQAFDEAGKPVLEQKGELVCVASFPSQPVGFWDDPERKRYRGAYFEHYDNVWRHGDYIEITARGGVIIYGRSDATLNPGGVRIGTAELYRAVEPLPSIQDCLVVGHDVDDDVEVVLFVKLNEGHTLDDALKQTLKQTIRKDASPRHVPAKIIEVADIPYTLSGKKVELAVRKVIHGQEVLNHDALANPQALDCYRNLKELQPED